MVAPQTGPLYGRSSAPLVIPTITTGLAYTSGNVVGGLMTFGIDGSPSGILESITIACNSVQTLTWHIHVFDSAPLGSTWTDKTAPAIAAADCQKWLGVYSLAAPNSDLGTHTGWSQEGIGRSFYGSSLYAVAIAIGTPTFASPTDLLFKLGIIGD